MKFYQALCTLWSHRITALVAAATILLVSSAATTQAEALYILTGAEDTAIVLDGSTKAPKITSPMINLSTGSKSSNISLTAGQTVTIRHGDQLLAVQSKRETVASLLKRMEITPSPLEIIAVDVSDTGVSVTVAEDILYYDRVGEPAAYGTVRVPNPDMVVGTERVVREGQEGVRTSIYEVVWSNGVQISRQLVQTLDSTAVDEIVEYGTAPAGREAFSKVEVNEDGSGTLYFPSGAALEFSGTKAMTATAYTAGYDGADYTTATGTFVKIGVVAVDKNVIPLGTRMYIITDDGIVYGVATAEDTGVRGDKVDLYMETYEDCINFGRRSCTVYFLK